MQNRAEGKRDVVDQTNYDTVPYPAAVHATTHPDRLAALARLHGLSAPDPSQARVLEIAGGDGNNVMAMAAAHPGGRYLSFDLATAAVARGEAVRVAAGLNQVRIEARDVIETAESMDEEFDYVVAHGLYAWAPPAVQQATLRLAARVLSPEGIAFISYNALPGCHMRRAVREILFNRIDRQAPPAQMLAQARALLSEFSQEREGDRAVVAALRDVARPMLKKHPSTLFHDELGEIYDPQSLTAIVHAARAHGLAFLNNAEAGGLFDGLPGEDLDDAEALTRAQIGDDEAVAFFHQTLLIRDGRRPGRRVDATALQALYGSAAFGLKRLSETAFAFGGGEIEMDDRDLADFLDRLIAAFPLHVALADCASSPARREALLHLANRGALLLHALPFPGTLTPGENPLASPLVRGQIARGETAVTSLAQRTVLIEEPGPRAFLSLLDGTRNRARLAAEWAESGFSHETDVEGALSQFSAAGFLLA